MADENPYLSLGQEGPGTAGTPNAVVKPTKANTAPANPYLDVAPGEAEGSKNEQKLRLDYLRELTARKGKANPLDLLEDGFTLSVARPMSGVGGALRAYTSGKGTAGEGWRAGVGSAKDWINQGRDEWPILGRMAEFGGSMLSGGPVRAGASRLAQMGQAGLTAGIEGAAQNSESPGKAALGAGQGSLIGAGVQGVLGGLIGRYSKGSRTARESVDEASRGGHSLQLAEDGSKIFTRLDNAGVTYDPRVTAPLGANVAARMAREGFNPNMHAQLIPAMSELWQGSGGRMTWGQLQNARTQIGDLRASGDKRTARLANELNDVLDDFIQNAKPTMPQRSVQAGVNPAQEVLEARDLWQRYSRASKAEHMGFKASKADDPALALEGDARRRLVSMDKKGRVDVSPDQVAIMDRMAQGSPEKRSWAKGLDYAAQGLGGLGLVGTAAAGTGAITGMYDPGERTISSILGAAALAGAGKMGSSVLRRAATDKTHALYSDLLRNIATHSTTPAANAYAPRDALARLMGDNLVSRGGGNYAARFLEPTEDPK